MAFQNDLLSTKDGYGPENGLRTATEAGSQRPDVGPKSRGIARDLLNEAGSSVPRGHRASFSSSKSRFCSRVSSLAKLLEFQKRRDFEAEKAWECYSKLRIGAPCRLDHLYPRKKTPLRNDLSIKCPFSCDFPKRAKLQNCRSENVRILTTALKRPVLARNLARIGATCTTRRDGVSSGGLKTPKPPFGTD